MLDEPTDQEPARGISERGASAESGIEIRPLLVDALLPIAALVAFVGGWAAVVTVLDVPAYLLPHPEAVASRLLGNPELYAMNAIVTLERIVYGGAIGIAGGFAIAALLSSVQLLRAAILPYIVTIRVLPKIAIAPALVIYMGTGMQTSIVFIATIAFFPMVLSTMAGLGRLDRRYTDLLRSVNARPVRGFVAVRLRFALPDVISGLKQSVTLAVVGAIVAEWVVADGGLGSLILLASENLLTDVMLAALVVLLVEGLALYGLVVLVERRLLWYRLPGEE